MRIMIVLTVLYSLLAIYTRCHASTEILVLNKCDVYHRYKAHTLTYKYCDKPESTEVAVR